MFSQKRHQESFFLWENPARADFLWCCWQLLLRISLIFPMICLQLLCLKKLYADLRWSSFWDAASSASSVETETGQKNGSHKSGPSRQPAEPLYTFHYNFHYKLSTTILSLPTALSFAQPAHYTLHIAILNWNVPYLLLYRWNKESKCRKGERRLSGEYEFYFAQMMIRIVRLIHNLTPQFKIRQFDTTIQKIWHGNILHQKIWHHNEKSDNLTRKYFTPDNLTHLSWCQIVVVSKQ